MTEDNKHLNLYSDGADWQNFLNAMIGFSNSRVKDEPTSEIYSQGLEVYLHLPSTKRASLFLLDTDGFLFHHSLTLPFTDKSEIENDFNMLLNKGAIASALQSGKIIFWNLEIENSDKRSFLIIPLIDNSGVIGLVIVETASSVSDYEQIMLSLCSFHSFQFTSLIDNTRLVKQLAHAQSVLEQKISLRTQDLKKRQRELRLILDSIHTGVFIIEPSSQKIIDANLAALDILKMPREWVLNSERSQFSVTDSSKPLSEDDSKYNLSNGESYLKDRNGSTIPIIRTISNINLGEDLYHLESFVDVSDRKSALRALVESESRFRTIFENAGIGMVITDLNGRMLDTNSAFRDILHYKEEELTDKLFSDFLLSGKYSYDDSAINTREEKIKRNGGETIWARITTNLMKDSSGKPLFGVEMVEDISDSKSNQEILEKQTNLLNGVADATTELLTELNFEEAIQNAMRLLGRSSDVDRVYIYKFLDEESSVRLSRKFGWERDTLKSPEGLDRDFEFSLDKKTSEWYHAIAEGQNVCGLTSASKGNEKKLLDYLGVKSFLVVPVYVQLKVWGILGFVDCSDERRWSENEESILKATAVAIGGAIQRENVKKELLESKEKAEKSVKLKTEFLAQMSHEIRTPINSILNFSGIIKEELASKIDDDLKTGLKIIDKAGKRIIRTMDLILNMSDIQTGNYEYQANRINLYTDVLEKQYLEFMQHARDKNLEFKLHKPTCNTDVECDEYTANQIFNNLIDNAIKYTMKGNVEIFIETDEDDQLVTIIKDTGIGISKEYLPRLFDPFTQEEQGYTRKFEGNGLGMALVKKYCELNKAAIEVNSKKGKGTICKIIFPKS